MCDVWLYFSINIEWDLTNGPLSKLLELLDTQGLGVRSVGPVGDFLEIYIVLPGSRNVYRYALYLYMHHPFIDLERGGGNWSQSSTSFANNGLVGDPGQDDYTLRHPRGETYPRGSLERKGFLCLWDDDDDDDDDTDQTWVSFNICLVCLINVLILKCISAGHAVWSQAFPSMSWLND